MPRRKLIALPEPEIDTVIKVKNSTPRQRKAKLNPVLRDPDGHFAGSVKIDTAEIRAQKNRDNANAYNKRINSTARDIAPLPNNINWERRDACRRDLKLFAKTYMPAVFYLSWSDDQLRCIRKLEDVYLEGGMFALAMPRGGGKSALSRCSIVWGTAYGYRRFPYFVGSTQPKAAQTLEFIKTYWYQSPLLQQDFPEVGYPIRCIENRGHFTKGQTFNGILTHIDWGKDAIMYPCLCFNQAEVEMLGWADHEPDHVKELTYDISDEKLYILRSGGVFIGTAGIDGSIRGEAPVHPILLTQPRPDVVLLDDIQKDVKADSPTSCEKMIRVVDGAVQGLAGPGQTIAAIMPCTVIREDDVADQYLDPLRHPEWRGERCAMVISWPDGITDYDISLDTPAGKAWNEYSELRRKSLLIHEDDRLAHEFYCNNREVMDEGFVVSWQDRYDAKREVSPQQHAMNLRLRSPATFPAEFQNKGRKLYVEGQLLITAKQLAAKVIATERFHVPANVQYVTAFIDIQDEIIFYVVLGVSPNFDGVVTEYGTWPPVPVPHFRKFQTSSWSMLTTKFFEKYPLHKDQAIRTDAGKLRAPLEAKIYFAVSSAVKHVLSLNIIRDDEHKTPMSVMRMAIDTRWGQASDVIKRYIVESGMYQSKMIVPYYGQPFPPTNRQLEEYELREGWMFEHMQNPECKEPKWAIRPNPDGMFYMVSDVNRGKDFAFARFASPPGTPGSIALFNAPADAHSMYAQHICNSEYPEPVVARGTKKNMWMEREGGFDNDFLDCTVGAMQVASMLGASIKTTDTMTRTAPRRSLGSTYREKRGR